MQRKILVADDEPNIVEVLKTIFEEAGYEVWTAYDGQEALDLLNKSWPDLIILDLLMPKVSGREFCQLLQSDPLTREIPVLILSAWSQNISAEEREQLHAYDYISKPFNLFALLDQVEKILGPRKN